MEMTPVEDEKMPYHLASDVCAQLVDFLRMEGHMSSRSPLGIACGPPGIGKTRWFRELCRLVWNDSPPSSDAPQETMHALLNLLADFCVVFITFNGNCSLRDDELTTAAKVDVLFPLAVRILFIWYSHNSKNFIAFEEHIRQLLSEKHLSWEEIAPTVLLRKIQTHLGTQHVLLLFDEATLVTDSVMRLMTIAKDE